MSDKPDQGVHKHPPRLAIVTSETDGSSEPDTAVIPDDVLTSDEFESVGVFATALPRCGKLTGSGGKCQQPVVAPGAAVCRVHGGSAPHVRAAAIERLRDTRDAALERLIHTLKERGASLDPRTLLDIVTKLTDKVELLEGRATARTETTELNLVEIRATFNSKLDDLASSYARAPMVLDMIDKMMGEGGYSDEANG